MSPQRSKRISRGLVLASVLLVTLVVPIGTVFAQPSGTATQSGVASSVNSSQVSSSSATPVTVSVNRTTIHARTGDLVNITSTVNNTGNASVGPVTVYLTLIDVKTHAPLDLEDWAATRAHQIDSLGPGHSTAQNWSLKAIKGGTYRVFINIVPKNVPSGSQQPTAVSHGVNIMLTQRNNLNPGNVTPTIIGVPVGLLVLAGGLVTVRRRTLRRNKDLDDTESAKSGGDER